MNCPKCNKETTYLDSCIEVVGMCEDCLNIAKGLVKDDEESYYVPWSYRNWVDTNHARSEEDFEEKNMFIPEVTWSDEYGKWKLSLNGADSGGHDIQNFEIYFDSKKDIAKLIGLE